MNKRVRAFAFALGIALAGCASQPKQAAPVPPTNQVPAQPQPSQAEELVKALKARSQAGDVAASTCLGEMYMTGAGVDQDLEAAGPYLAPGNAKNYAQAEVLEAILVGTRPEWGRYISAADRQVEELSKAGDPQAETFMGIQTRYGSNQAGIKGDLATSLHWLQLAAAQDDAIGEAELAAAYKHGWGVPQDPVLAKQWLDKAAHHSYECIADYARVVESLVQANVVYPAYAPPGIHSETVILSVPLNGAAGVVPLIATSSGDPAFDVSALAAAMGLPLPTWSAAPSGAKDLRIPVAFSRLYADPTLNYAWAGWSTKATAAIYQEAAILWAQNPYRTQAQGMALVGAEFKEGKLSDVKVLQSSGDTVLDAYSMKAVETAALPPAPGDLAGQTFQVSYWLTDGWDSSCFEDPEDEPHSAYATAVRAAVCKAEVAPRHALLFGTPGSGITAVDFDIRAGKVGHIRVIQSSGDAEVDRAAVAAVKHAQLPSMPAEDAKHTLRISTHVIFELGSTTPAPAAASSAGAG